MRRHVLPVLASVAILAGCSEPYSRPHVPLPAISGTYLDGRPLSREDLLGKPWVINLWVPG
jgi:hypothetical protein